MAGIFAQREDALAPPRKRSRAGMIFDRPIRPTQLAKAGAYHSRHYEAQRRRKYTRRVTPGYAKWATPFRQPLRGYLGPSVDEHYRDFPGTGVSFYAVPNGITPASGIVPPVAPTVVGYPALSNPGQALEHVDVVPRGTGVQERLAKAYRITSGQIQYSLEGLGFTQVTNPRIVLIWDYQPNRILPQWSDIFASPGGAGTPVSLMNRDNQSRFKVLWSRQHTITGNFLRFQNAPAQQPDPAVFPARPFLSGNTDTSVQMVSANFVMPAGCGYAQCDEADTTGVISGRISGAMYLCMIADSPPPVITATWDPSTSVASLLSFRLRLNFVDV